MADKHVHVAVAKWRATCAFGETTPSLPAAVHPELLEQLLFGCSVLQIGKSGASWITQAFLLGCGSIAAAMPFTGVIFAGVILTWIKVWACALYAA